VAHLTGGPQELHHSKGHGPNVLISNSSCLTFRHADAAPCGVLPFVRYMPPGARDVVARLLSAERFRAHALREQDHQEGKVGYVSPYQSDSCARGGAEILELSPADELRAVLDVVNANAARLEEQLWEQR